MSSKVAWGRGNVGNVLGNKDTSTRAEAPSKTLGGCKVTELHTKGGEKTARGHRVKGGAPGKAMVWYMCGAKAGTGRHQGRTLTCLCPFICLHHGKVPHASLPGEIPIDVGFTGEEKEGGGKDLGRFAQSSAEMAEWVHWVGAEETVRTPSERKVWAQ